MKIIVCDTNEDIREYLRKGVAAAGYNPVLARDGDEALSILNFSNAVGAILGAANTPPGEVVTLGRKIKDEKGAEFPVVVVGGQDLEPAQVMGEGIDAALKAPKPQVLVAELKRHFQGAVDAQAEEGPEPDASAAGPTAADDGAAPGQRRSAEAVRGKPVARSRPVEDRAPPAARSRQKAKGQEESARGGGTQPSAPAPPRRPPPQPSEPPQAAEEYAYPTDGSLLEHSAGTLLHRAMEEKKTGKLSFKKDTVVKDAFFKDGKLVYAASNVAKESIAGRLVEQGRMTEEQHKDAQTLAASSGGIEGALMQLGLIEAHEIMDLIKETAQGVLLDVFEWPGGRFAFGEGVKPPNTAPPMNFDVLDIIKKGIERLDGDRIKQLLADRFDQKAMKNHTAMERIDALGLKPAEFRISRMVNGRATGKQIVEEWAGDDAEKENRALQVLYLLTQTKMVELAAPVRQVEVDTGPSDEERQKEIQEEIERLEHSAEGLKGKNYFEVLGVDRGAELSECKKAFLKLARSHHPDTLPEDSPPELYKAQERLFGIYSEAADVLTDESKREEYIAELNAKDQVGDMEVDKVLEAETAFLDGEVKIKKKDYKGAVADFEKALELNPDEGEHLVLLGWAKFLESSGKSRSESQQLIKRGLKMRQDIDRGWMYLGHIEKQGGDIEKAEKYFLKALQINPNNSEAASEARLIQKRKGKGGGFFGRK